MMNNVDMQPLVSIGIPAYNRPEGLRCVLQEITAQTYKNLEIIVSDNCSPQKEAIEAVMQEFASDIRIQFFRQVENIGGASNFEFVLEKATGKYFAWAADDDLHAPNFIATLVHGLVEDDERICAVPRGQVKNYITQIEKQFPQLDITPDVFDTTSLIIQFGPVHFVYGVYKLSYIKEYMLYDIGMCFDWGDLIFVYNTCLQGKIFYTPEILYTAGIDTEKYVLKPYGGIDANKKNNQIFSYKKVIVNGTKVIFRAEKITFIEKIILLRRHYIFCFSAFLSWEKKTNTYKRIFAKLFRSILRVSFFSRIWSSTPKSL